MHVRKVTSIRSMVSSKADNYPFCCWWLSFDTKTNL